MINRHFLSFFFLLVLTVTTILVPTASASEILDAMEVKAKAALLMDPETDEILYSQNAEDRLYPASLTKIMTCLLVLEAVDEGKLSLTDTITASETAINSVPYGSSTAGLKIGETLTLEQMLYCTMVVSANEGSLILAETVAGSIDSFVDLMNRKAKELGCKDTHFENPNGLHDDNHYTTANDLYRITKAAMEYEKFMEICDTPNFTLPATAFHDERTLYTTNYLLSQYRALGYLYAPAMGIKTGYTDAAGNCLISAAQKEDRMLLGIVLGAEKVTLEDGKTQVQSFTEMKRMFEWGFSQFKNQTILSTEELIDELTVTLSETTHIVVRPKYDVERLLPNDLLPEELEREITFPTRTVEAPIQEGQVLGTITLSYGDTEYASVPLVAQNDVESSPLLVFQKNVTDFVNRTEVRIGAGVLVVAIAALAIFVKVKGNGRRRYGGGRSGYGTRNYRGRKR